MGNERNVNIGNSGEYFVAAELERRGLICAVPMSNVKVFDLLAINPDTLEQFAIQVKTTEKKSKDWLLSEKNECFFGANFFYVFVSLNYLEQPEYHIVPSEVVARRIKADYEEWLITPGRNGQKHNTNNKRHFKDRANEYLDKWDYLTGNQNNT